MIVKKLKYNHGFLVRDKKGDIWRVLYTFNNMISIECLNKSYMTREEKIDNLSKNYRPFFMQVGEVFTHNNVQYTLQKVEHRNTLSGLVYICDIQSRGSHPLSLTVDTLLRYI